MDFLFNFLIQSGLDTSSPWSVLWWLFTHGGFIFIVWVILKGLSALWLNWRQGIYASKVKWIYLAIDVPRDNEQSPKAVEQIFNHLWGSIKGANLIEKWWDGYFQQNFSLELVSIEGYIQYIIRTQAVFRDLVEAAIYAQYPEAQITEIEDYTQEFTPDNFKEKGYNLWGAQFGLVKDEIYPIKTYPLFEHPISKTIVDPMAAILEVFSRMGKGEQAWLQIVIKPVADDWKEKSEKEVKKIVGAKTETKKSAIDKLMDAPSGIATKIGDVVFGPAAESGKKEEKLEVPSKMLYLSPGERETVEAIDRKATKTGFKTKIRYIYLAKKEVFSKPKGVSGLVGALRQFTLLNANGFKPVKGTVTKADYFRVEQRVYRLQRKILKNYKSRSSWAGGDKEGFILNTEELASIYHFPSKGIVAPTLKTIEAKRSEAPFELPVESEEVEEMPLAGGASEKVEASHAKKKAAPPENLPI